MNAPRVWGIHMGVQVGTDPIERGYVAIGWSEIGDPGRLEPTREAFKEAVAATYPDHKPGAIPLDAGTLWKFAHDMAVGDVVVYSSKADRTINIGRIAGGHDYVPDDPNGYTNHRKVEWLLPPIPRSEVPQAALNEIGSFLTLIRVRRHADWFLRRAGLAGPATDAVDDDEEADDEEAQTASISEQAEVTTEDFITKRLMTHLDGYEFEAFVAHLLECMGYTARVTRRSGDGGVDVIAHRDALGFEPPILKVQCKRTTGTTGRPDVDQLLGTLGDGEVGLFVNIGSYTSEAIQLERNRGKLRLIDAEQLIELILEHYDRLAPRYRQILPLRRIHVPDLTAGA